MHTVMADPGDPSRMFGAISAAGAFRSDDSGESWHEISGDVPSDFGFPIAGLPQTHCCVNVLRDLPAVPSVEAQTLP